MSSGQPATALSRLEAENLRLRRAVEELSVINEVATAVSSASSLETIVDLVVQKCVKHLAVAQGAVLIFGDQEHGAALRTMVRKVDAESGADPFRLSEQVIGWLLKTQAPLVINDAENDKRFPQPTLTADGSVKSLLCAPLRLHGKVIGVLSVFNKRSAEGFTQSDERLITIIAAQSAQVIENARLHEEEKALQLMQQEMRMAYDIQINLLPKSPPTVLGYDVAGKTTPAHNVGGDYFDFLAAGEGRLAICLGDVSGKGMPAAMLMANVQATIRGQTLLRPSPSECMRHSNQLLYQSTDSNKFVTFFYGLLDFKKHRLCYANAGHNPPILLRHGDEPRLLETGGPVLGILPNCDFEEAEVALEPGDTLLLYSDGFPEAMNRQFEEFGEERLLATLQEVRGGRSAVIVENLFDAVKEHSRDAPQTDDMTVVVVRAGS